MTYLIHGATGTQGAPLFRKMLAAGKAAVGAVRDPDSLKDAPAVAVDYNSVDSLAAAYEGAEGVFIHLPLGSEEQRLAYANNISQAIAKARPRRVVISTSGWQLPTDSADIDAAQGSLPTLVSQVQKTGVDTAIIAPKLYLENLLLPIILEPISQESVLRYPLRADYPVSWCSHLDVAEAAFALFEQVDVNGIVTLGQLPALTGTDLAKAFSNHFGRAIRYQSLEPEAFGKLLTPLFGEAAAAEVAAGYEAHAKAQHAAIDDTSSAQHRLNLKPLTVEQWLTEMGIG